MTKNDDTPSWTTAWIDVLAFALGLAVAWYREWTTTDLIWSLWLSSLVVGYATILWGILEPRLRDGRRSRSRGSVGLGAALFLLAFFSFHFGMFHYGHSQILATFFPIDGTVVGYGEMEIGAYLEVVRRCWTFLPAALLAERAIFAPRPGSSAMLGMFERTRAPYRNVVRMHLLIFFFAAVSHVGLESFAVYAVVYAVYFFPWRLVRSSRPMVRVSHSS